jgi:hypothetical protein
MSTNTTTFNYYNWAFYIIELPNVEDWIITDIWFNSSRPAENDLAMSMSIDYPDDDMLIDFDKPDILSTGIFADLSAGSGTGEDYERHTPVPLDTAIEIYDRAGQPDTSPIMTLGLGEYPPTDSFGDHAWTINFQIYGEQVSDWSLKDSVFGALAGTTALSLGVLVYMTDGIDLGGYTKVLRRKRW